jgi:hypothetical protein
LQLIINILPSCITLVLYIYYDHPYYHICPDILSPVRYHLSGNGCGSPNRTVLVSFFTVCFTY